MGGLTLGAIGAALIAAVVSLVGLVVAKDQKTSEFRQAWVDALRAEIVEYLIHVNSIADAHRQQYANFAEKRAALSPLYTCLNRSAFAIGLRLNPEESRSKAIIAAMRNLQSGLAGETMTADAIRPLEAELLAAAQRLLKFEWKRVKRGEIGFQIARVAACILLVGCVACVSIATLYPSAFKQEAGGQSRIGKSQEPPVQAQPKLADKTAKKPAH